MMKLTEELDFELESGKIVPTEIKYTIVTVPNDGADADGNRGVDRRVLDDYDFSTSPGLTDEEKEEMEEIVANHVLDFIKHGEILSEDV